MRIGENEYKRMEFAGAFGDLGRFIPLEIITQGMIWGSGIFTAFFWLAMGFTGAVSWLHKITSLPIIRGIMLGLGLSFVMEGIGMMKGQPVVAIITVAMTFYLLSHGKIPGMLIAAIGGIPLCHGAGGMAGHVPFGARTGDALVIRAGSS